MAKEMSVNEHEFFTEATLRICSSLDLDVALHRLMDYIKNFVPVSELILSVYHQDSGILEVNATASVSAAKRPHSRFVMKKKYRDKIMTHWDDKNNIYVMNSPNQVKQWQKEAFVHSYPLNSSMVHMQLKLEDQKIGSLTVYAEGANRFGDEHLRLLSRLNEPVAIAFSNALKHQELLRLQEILADDTRYLQRQLLNMSGKSIIGADSGLKDVMENVRQVARQDSPVLLLGETGVGKEIIANSLHRYSQRKNGPFIKVNCGAIPETLIDSELFGHDKGAFTGAATRKRGRFERAHNGTIFLDEIGELPLQAQVRLLRVLQTKEIERVGGTSTVPVNVRIISATNRNLQEMLKTGRFREDLWFRINVFPIMMPPLRQRKRDIPALVNFFIKKKCIEMKIRDLPAPDPDAIEKLTQYHWPGNVRELENMVERALIRCQGGSNHSLLRFEDTDALTRGNADQEKSDRNEILGFEQTMKQYIEHVLQLSEGKVGGKDGAARLMGLNPSTLRSKMRKMDISFGRGE